MIFFHIQNDKSASLALICIYYVFTLPFQMDNLIFFLIKLLVIQRGTRITNKITVPTILSVINIRRSGVSTNKTTLHLSHNIIYIWFWSYNLSLVLHLHMSAHFLPYWSSLHFLHLTPVEWWPIGHSKRYLLH